MSKVNEVAERLGLKTPWEGVTHDDVLAEWIELNFKARNGGIDQKSAERMDEITEWMDGSYIFYPPDIYHQDFN